MESKYYLEHCYDWHDWVLDRDTDMQLGMCLTPVRDLFGIDFEKHDKLTLIICDYPREGYTAVEVARDEEHVYVELKNCDGGSGEPIYVRYYLYHDFRRVLGRWMKHKGFLYVSMVPGWEDKDA